MTEEQRKLCFELVICSPKGVRRISKEAFLRQFPTAVREERLALEWLDQARREQNAQDLTCALIVGFTFGFTQDHADILCALVDADWHFSHEDIVSALDELRTPNSVDALFRATQWIPEYLGFDDSRALASKAIWALGRLPGDQAAARLMTLAGSGDPILSNGAVRQLERRAAQNNKAQ